MIEPGTTAGGVPVQIENSNGTVINPSVGFAIGPFDTIVINYVDSTKAVIATVQYKKGVTLVATITYTSASTTDTYVQT